MHNKLFIFTFLSANALCVAAENADAVMQACIASNQLIALDAASVGLDNNGDIALGSYERFSPDGRFVLRSFSGARLGDVSLIELPAPQPVRDYVSQSLAHTSPSPQISAPLRAYKTPLSNESFPVQGTWRYLVDTYGAHYRLMDILTRQQAAKPLFKAGMTGFYAAAAELAPTQGQDASHIKIRSFSWPNATATDDNQGTGALTTRTIEVDTVAQKVVADSGARSICTRRAHEDGTLYALPMISVDGTEFAALPQNPPAQINGKKNTENVTTMRIYSFGDSGFECLPRAQFLFSSGKTIFAYPTARAGAQGSADLAYEYRGQVWWYHRSLGRAFHLAPQEAPLGIRSLLASAFPGITRDGRVIYAATWEQCTAGANCMKRVGYVISDPYQSNDYRNFLLNQSQDGSVRNTKIKDCITYEDVARERAAFALFHKIP